MTTIRKPVLLLLLALAPALAGVAQGARLADVENTLRERIRLTGYAQGGFEYHDDASPSNDFKLSRIILMAEGRITDRARAFAMYDLKASSLHEMWMDYRFAEVLTVKVGQFKTPFSIENPISPTLLETIYPLSLATTYMIGGGSACMMPGSAGRDLGVQVGGDLGRWGHYDVALMNGAGRNQRDDNAQKDLVGRLSVRPVEGLLLSASALRGTGTLAPNAASAWHGVHANGRFRRDRYAVGGEWKSRPWQLRTEAMAGRDGKRHSKALYATTSVNHVGLEALDVVASYDYLDTGLGRTNRWTVGVQYWFYPQCRIQLGYGLTHEQGASTAHSVLTQLQLAF